MNWYKFFMVLIGIPATLAVFIAFIMGMVVLTEKAPLIMMWTMISIVILTLAILTGIS